MKARIFGPPYASDGEPIGEVLSIEHARKLARAKLRTVYNYIEIRDDGGALVLRYVLKWKGGPVEFRVDNATYPRVWVKAAGNTDGEPVAIVCDAPGGQSRRMFANGEFDAGQNESELDSNEFFHLLWVEAPHLSKLFSTAD